MRTNLESTTLPGNRFAIRTNHRFLFSGLSNTFDSQRSLNIRVVMKDTSEYLEIVKHYESCLDKFGDTFRGVDWPNASDVVTRYQVMLELIKSDKTDREGMPVTLLDFGCGAGHLLEYLRSEKRSEILYSGLDASQKFIELCRSKFPGTQFHCLDILQSDLPLNQVDYVVMNGVFTEKRSLSFNEMFAYFCQVIRRVFPLARHGLAFNVMSMHVDWERDDLFHLPFDSLAKFLRAEISRNYQFRADYGLYEYTAYVYR